VLPDWLAWETFGEANGVDSFAALQSRLSRIRKGAGIERDPAGRIGCCLIAEAVFFEPERWVAPPSDWKRNIVVGAGYDLSSGEGERMWTECLAQAAARATDTPAAYEEQERYGKPTMVAPRLGQPIFRIRVLDAYGRACAVTQEHSLPVLDAAHIVPYASGGKHEVSNGLLLRSDLHRLFDHGYVTVDEGLRFVVSHRLRDDFANGRSYYSLHGNQLALPNDSRLIPDNAALEWHRTEAFLG